MAVIYEGASTTTGTDIVVLTTEDSKNRKTGNMLQVFFLLKDTDPNQAYKAARGQEKSAAQTVCGGCKHLVEGSCYILWHQAPLSTWRRYKRGGHDGKRFNKYLPVRLGAAGNPNSAPYEVSFDLVKNAPAHTGYTHQFLTCDQRFSKILMASVESKAEAKAAQKLGWRTFRTVELGKLDDLLPGEIVCPATQMRADGYTPKTDCATCGLCSGTEGRGKASIVVEVHGKSKAKFKSDD